MKRLTLGLILLITINCCFSLTEKQMKSAAKLVRNSCIPKSKVTEAQVMKLHAGDWADESNPIKCYMNCALSMLKVCKKNGEFDLEAALKQVPTLPESRQEPTASSMKKCGEEVQANDDKCDSSWRFAKCLYFDNPENYFLP
ncbi:PREDICTED: general odorant-binding protein lush-like [Nicrophorus vespilloides]|uniref:General odorant-binding protein lush-like n=1 Tax=Nicrophorus vespilloides TaxID=110193 RepID=A0ABM1M8Y2_NICVS|nr:PREDICTED: general odorant-binding protein lush-like [Nicrophorus vespilloides]